MFNINVRLARESEFVAVHKGANTTMTMKIKRTLAAALGGVLLAAGSVALGANFNSSKQVDFFAAGQHQFYVWCAGGRDYTALAKGSNAMDAQMKLYNGAKANGKSSCWPVWQGRVSS